MANIVEDFVQSPSEELLEQCTKEQLIKIAQNYSIEVEPKRTKENLRSIIKANLQECGVLMDGGGKSGVSKRRKYVIWNAAGHNVL